MGACEDYGRRTRRLIVARHLLLRLRAPLIAFGGETIDNLGVTRRFPALSMVTGLFANALGWDRADDAAHNILQSRLRIGTRLESEGRAITDFQTAQLDGKDVGWTTRGVPEGRAGGAATYESPHLRYRDFYADLDALVALRLNPASDAPTLEDLANALDRPARPLFIGRKPCVPSTRLFAGWCEANDILSALRTQPIADTQGLPVQWPEGEGEQANALAYELCDERNWTSGVHGGWRRVLEGTLRQTES